MSAPALASGTGRPAVLAEPLLSPAGSHRFTALSEGGEIAGTTAMVTVSPGWRFIPVSVQAGEDDIWNVRLRGFDPDWPLSGTATAQVINKRIQRCMGTSLEGFNYLPTLPPLGKSRCGSVVKGSERLRGKFAERCLIRDSSVSSAFLPAVEGLNFHSQIPIVTMCEQQQNRLWRLSGSSWWAITRKISS